jgi:hypothetical protein
VIKARHIDEKRRVILPPEIQPGTDVIIDRIDEDSWVITRHRGRSTIYLPVVDKLPDDPDNARQAKLIRTVLPKEGERR